MREFFELRRHNRNYRYIWMGQVASEIDDNFNNIAVFALAMRASRRVELLLFPSGIDVNVGYFSSR